MMPDPSPSALCRPSAQLGTPRGDDGPAACRIRGGVGKPLDVARLGAS